ncbi:MAG TPA: SRPBCC family protein [Flavitalea sp.]|nr:SRPBCC family protein [Flavitalea sp.]
MPLFEIDPDIAKAKTLHSSFYTDPTYFDAAKERIFVPSVQFIGSTDLLVKAGDNFPFTLLPDYLDEPLLLTRDKNGLLHCLSNVCTHRGNLLITSPCNVPHIRCKYHGRVFTLEGRFQSMPEFREVKDFPSADDDLTQLPLYQWGKWLFTSAGNQNNSEKMLGDMISRMNWLPLEEFVYRPDLGKIYEVQAHWALYCENYLEGFHIPFVHADLNAVIDYGNYTTELFGWSNLQVGYAKDAADCFDIPHGAKDHGKKIAAYYFWVFPNMMFNFYPWGLSVNIVEPISIDRTRVRFLTYMMNESRSDQGAGGNLDKVELEDEEIVQQVQTGVKSRFYQHGRYSVTREQGTHHFHRLIASMLNA